MPPNKKSHMIRPPARLFICLVTIYGTTYCPQGLGGGRCSPFIIMVPHQAGADPEMDFGGGALLSH